MASNANIFIKAKYDGKEADSGLDRLNQKLKQNAVRLQNAQETAKRFNAQLNRTQVRFRTQALTANKVLKAQNEIMREQQMKMKQLGNAALGVGLSMLFLGMQIKALSQRTLQSIFKTFSEVTQGTMAYNQTVGRVSAAFEFLKFSIADAFMTSALGQALVETLISIFDFISGASDETKIFLVIVLLLGVAFGALAMTIGQLIIPLKVALDSGFTLKAIALGIGAAFVAIVIVLLTIAFLIKVWNSDVSFLQKLVVTILALFFAILIILALFGVTLSIPIVLMVALIALVVALGLAFLLAKDQMMLGFLKAFKAINDALFKLLIEPINDLIRKINRIRSIAGKSEFDLIQNTTGGGLDSKIAALEASIAQKKAEREAKKSEDNSITTTSSNVFIDTFKAQAKDVTGAVNEAMDLDQYNSLSGE